MSLRKLAISNVRNISACSTELHPRLNLLYGDNASGKSSFLEALFILGRSKSFRTQIVSQVVNHRHDHLVVFGELEDSTVGIKKSTKETEVKISGQRIKSLSTLASLLPIQFIHPGSLNLIEGPPSNRRQFIDWGLFHVKHHFADGWKNYRRILNQRNALLRASDVRSIEAWDKELSQYGELISNLRKEYVELFLPLFSQIFQTFFPGRDCKIRLKKGWDDSLSLKESLTNGINSDIKNGFTQSGPHRADFRVIVDDKRAESFFSRGQLKLLVLALNFAQAGIMSELNKNPGCVLIDDLSSELDNNVKKYVFNYLKQINSQIFITSINKETFSSLVDQENFMFHVEHGEINRV